MPSAFTLATTRDHWEVLLRARAIENQCFIVAANQIGAHRGGYRSGGRSMIVDPWGLCAGECSRHRDGDRRGSRSRACCATSGGRLPSLAHRRPEVYGWSGLMATAAVDKRRMILDAAVRVFARQGFHTCRVSDIADEAGVAYGLVYHYFSPRSRSSTRCSWSAGT